MPSDLIMDNVGQHRKPVLFMTLTVMNLLSGHLRALMHITVGAAVSWQPL